MVEFRSLPFIVQFWSIANILMAWILFAEFVIDRHGWDRVLPYYRVGNLCPYELAVVLGSGVLWSALRRTR